VVSDDTMALMLSPEPMPVEVIAALAAGDALAAVLLVVGVVDEPEVVPEMLELMTFPVSVTESYRRG